MNKILNTYYKYENSLANIEQYLKNAKEKNVRNYNNKLWKIGGLFTLNFFALILAIIVFTEPKAIHIFNLFNLFISIAYGWYFLSLKPFEMFKEIKNKEKLKNELADSAYNEKDLQQIFNVLFKNPKNHRTLESFTRLISGKCVPYNQVHELVTLYLKESTQPDESLFQQMAKKANETENTPAKDSDENIQFFAKS